jgi:hypothetical protein
MKTELNKVLRLTDALKIRLTDSDLNGVLMQARLTPYDFEVLTSELETIDEDSLASQVIADFDELSNASKLELHAASQDALTDEQKHEITKGYIDSLWSKSAKDKPLLEELHEMLESELDTQEPLRTRIFNLADLLASIGGELESESPDLVKIQKWIKNAELTEAE